MVYQFAIKIFSEIAENSLRGGLASFMQLQSNLGVAFVNALNIGHVVNWINCNYVSGIYDEETKKWTNLLSKYLQKKVSIPFCVWLSCHNFDNFPI